MSVLSPIAAFARIKPLDADAGAGTTGTAAAKRIVGWEVGPPGNVRISGVGSSSISSSSGDAARGGAEAGDAGESRQSATIKTGIKAFENSGGTVAPEATQVAAYELIGKPLVAKWLDGFDVDLLSYGQTGSGKTYTMFGPPHSMAVAEKALSDMTDSSDMTGGASDSAAAAHQILRAEHGCILRAGFEALEAITALRKAGTKAVVHASMVEISIASLSQQSVHDLLNNMAPCYVDEQHHLQGARQVALETPADVVRMAAKVENRLTRGTKMNDTSSRSHCITVFTLTVVFEDNSLSLKIRQSRLQFFDLMGSERFAGQNAAHDTSKSSKSTTAGWEGIFSNLSLHALMSAIDVAAEARRTKKKCMSDSAMGASFLLTKLLLGSLKGGAVTGMVTCLSQAARNGEESWLSLKYAAGMAQLLNKPERQPTSHNNIKVVIESARKARDASAGVLAKGVLGKFKAKREAEVQQMTHDVAVLERLLGGGVGTGGGE